ncbi:hypothetical protein COLU111180_04575 [Cohnella lubricantis]|uniref:NRDE family protein n=1 Tax=Cohnella lubricantis TaxID=2163172 RepID=A0A841TDV1_9BACL|nr:hypothetical protein [Cohnella lubricantis]MBB6677157.1 hypothetical protein [Cohnella lubricantis]MBP2117032.1 hypothetical protein [Cohnella lubricantis]
MCTIGIVACRNLEGELRIFGFKNADNPPVGYWHGRTGTSVGGGGVGESGVQSRGGAVAGSGGYASLAFGLLPQTGVNAGLNERGLLVISSFFGFEAPEQAKEPDGYWHGDIRGKTQAEALARCDSAADALALLAERYRAEDGPTTGGSHLLADREGRLYAFEHAFGEMAWQDASQAGWAARSNQSFGLFPAEQRSQREEIVRDRELRLRTAEEALAGLAGRPMPEEQALEALRRLLASHGPSDGGEELGSICAHGVPYGRSNAAVPHDTVSGLLWNVSAGEMAYTSGPPCRSTWHKLRFADEEGS